ncbi:MAG: hypothetical protein QXP93_05565 [Nitrososphaerota archaeon]
MKAQLFVSAGYVYYRAIVDVDEDRKKITLNIDDLERMLEAMTDANGCGFMHLDVFEIKPLE